MSQARLLDPGNQAKGRSDGNYGHRLPIKSSSKWREPTARLAFAKGYRYYGSEMGDANNSTVILVDCVANTPPRDDTYVSSMLLGA